MPPALRHRIEKLERINLERLVSPRLIVVEKADARLVDEARAAAGIAEHQDVKVIVTGVPRRQ